MRTPGVIKRLINALSRASEDTPAQPEPPPAAPAPLPPPPPPPPAPAHDMPPNPTSGPSLEDLPDALLEAVLINLDATTLLQRVAPLNHRFCRVAGNERLWLDRLPPELAAVLSGPRSDEASGSLPTPPTPLLRCSAARLYCSLANANLLSNPEFSLEAQMEQRRSRGGDAPGRGRPPWLVPVGSNTWAWDATATEGLVTPPGEAALPPPPPPAYDPQGPGERRPPGVVASSWNFSGLLQEVDLEGELRLRGLSLAAAHAFLDACPTLVLEFFVAGRFDCDGWAEACVVLDDGRSNVPLGRDELNQWMERAPSMADLPPEGVEGNVWRSRQLRVKASGPGMRRAVVLLAGSENRQWAGHYGAKFASPVLRFAMPE